MIEDDLINQLRKMIEYTKKNRIPWKFLNEQTYRWVKQETLKNNQIITTIQYAGRHSRISKNNETEAFEYYILNIQSTNPAELLLQITSNEESHADLLTEVFNAAREASKVTTADVLKNLLNDV
ncbi:hypothetical protein EHR01_06400 [Leptospira mtsangambouensis]|uniref:Uncharacterized protein n=1 Tax=Leptospira mtsangambouensis TaxID=2484912 RepID=A0ABY2P5K2_9LEPT|nr:hypothetical protein [Leptospira mtsangambouensis]TGM82407.1 hypothetical protein EHR01_06400 [Leptospira mtsangambouensis]